MHQACSAPQQIVGSTVTVQFSLATIERESLLQRGGKVDFYNTLQKKNYYIGFIW